MKKEPSREEIKSAVLAGKIFVYPTDTLYGIGGNALDGKVIERIRKLKGREGKKPFSVIMGTLGMILEYCEVGDGELRILMQHLPGPYTFILKVRSGKKLPPAENGKIGVRVPEHVFARKLSSELNIPIITTSANLSGEKPAIRLEDVDKKVLKAVDFCIDGGETRYKEGSTVVDLVERKILRRGAGEFLSNTFKTLND